MVKPDIFYNIENLSFKEKEKLVYECINLSDRNIVEELNCRHSWQRYKSDLNVDEFMEKFDKSCFLSIKKQYDILYEKYFLSIVIRTMTTHTDYFLWIEFYNNNYMNILDYLKEKYNIKKK